MEEVFALGGCFCALGCEGHAVFGVRCSPFGEFSEKKSIYHPAACGGHCAVLS